MLRARLDGELNEPESLAIDTHLAMCADCRRREEIMTTRTKHVRALLASLMRLPGESSVDAQLALARFNGRRSTLEGGKTAMLNKLFSKPFRPVWGALAGLALVIAVLSFAPVGAWAERFLGLFRIKKITVVPMESSRHRMGDTELGRRMGQLLSDTVVVTKEAGEPQSVAHADEASWLAGFNVRLLNVGLDPSELWVKDDHAFRLTVDRERVQAILNEVGRPDLQLPASVDGATISVNIPKAVFAVYGDCRMVGSEPRPRRRSGWSDCVLLAQIPTPTVLTPPDLNLARIAEVGLQLIGMSEDEARSFSQTVDCTSTLVLPIPVDVASYQTVEVDGVKGTVITENRSAHRPAGYTGLWVKKGIIYSLTGFGDPAQGVALADSLR